MVEREVVVTFEEYHDDYTFFCRTELGYFDLLDMIKRIERKNPEMDAEDILKELENQGVIKDLKKFEYVYTYR